MFRKNDGHIQSSFSSFEMQMPEKMIKKMKKSAEWAFYTDVFSKIDEDIFSDLYSGNYSRPNSPVNLLAGSLILKELKKWTYAELFQHIEFDILTRAALGLHDLSVVHYAESTLFLFQQRLEELEQKTGQTLMKELLDDLNTESIDRLGLSVETIRIDSTFLDSNIRKYGRIQLLVEGLQRLWRILDKADKAKYGKMFSPYIKDSSEHYIYNLKSGESGRRLDDLAKIYTGLNLSLCGKYGGNKIFAEVFSRLCHEHIKIDEGGIAIKSQEELNSGCLQSPDDTEATYRNKNGEHHRGYSAQITETVDVEKGLSLITDVAVTPNNKDDSRYLEEKIDSYIESGAKKIHVDGGYGSEGIDAKLSEHEDVEFYQSAVKGRKKGTDLEIIKHEDGRYSVKCPMQEVVATRTSKRFKAKFDYSICQECPHQANCPAGKNKGKYYFSHSDYSKQKRHHAIDGLTKEERNIRSGCERTMFELLHDRKANKKMRVRGRFIMELNIFCRAIGTNFSRIFRHCTKKPGKNPETAVSATLFTLKALFIVSGHLVKRKIRKFSNYYNIGYNMSA